MDEYRSGFSTDMKRRGGMMEVGSMNEAERRAMMKSMMEQLFGGMGVDEKKEMCATMMEKMTGGLDMKDIMPKMMMGMMSGSAGNSSGEMQGGPAHQMSGMPEMMLKTMMPHCIGMMLPEIALDKRGEVAAAILAPIVEKGTAGMSDEQTKAFYKALDKVLHR
jgi:hypothetical protein